MKTDRRYWTFDVPRNVSRPSAGRPAVAFTELEPVCAIQNSEPMMVVACPSHGGLAWPATDTDPPICPLSRKHSRRFVVQV